MPLSPDQQTTLQNASPAALQTIFAQLRQYLGAGRWLSARNEYLIDATGTLRGQVGRVGGINEKHLREYIAASAPVHCVDGWSFLGRAIDAHCRGDSNSARHFAYYAELRASMSFLAVQGIGVFDRNHFVVNALRGIESVPGTIGTHKYAWLALQYWPTIPGTTSTIHSIIRPLGIPLSEWLAPVQGGTTTSAILATAWLREWGVDLRQFAVDRDTRNQASYRPTWFRDTSGLGIRDSSGFVCALWALCEPTASRFEWLDRQLLRISLRRNFRARTGRNYDGDIAGFTADVEAALAAVIPGSPLYGTVRDFLLGNTVPETSSLITEATGRVGVAHSKHHIQVISRAALLLRLASGACESLFGAAGIVRSDASSFCDAVGTRRGLWPPGSPPIQLSDLWSDVEAAIASELAWVSTSGINDDSIAEWRSVREVQLATFGECERIGLWGMGL